MMIDDVIVRLLEEFLHEAIVGFEPPLKQLRQSEEEVGAAVDGDGEDVAGDSEGLGEEGGRLALCAGPPRVVQLQ